VGGWYLPMYGAGWLERRNITEYEQAACLAFACGAVHHVVDLLEMAEAEWEHEHYFRMKAASHPLARVLPVWKAPSPKEEIRRRFLRTAPASRVPAHVLAAPAELQHLAYGHATQAAVQSAAEFGSAWPRKGRSSKISACPIQTRKPGVPADERAGNPPVPDAW
jgi:hypothetical protein